MSKLHRRQWLNQGARAAAVALPLCLPGWVRAQAAGPWQPTPAQTEGPFYPTETLNDTDGDLVRFGDRVYTLGQPVTVSGRVVNTRGQPVTDATVEIWQCDEAGHYRHPRGGPVHESFQGFGRTAVDAQGGYRFRTIRPSPYVGRTPHIHVKVRRGGQGVLTTQMYVAGLPSNERDVLYRALAPREREALTVPFESDGERGQRAVFDIVLRA